MKVEITGFDYAGRGVAKADGKIWFVRGALPGETVEAAVISQKKRIVEADTVAVLEPAAQRCEPFCRYYGDCGGCALQHVDFAGQLRLKEQVWLEQLARLGKITPEHVLPALPGQAQHYRSRARFAWDSSSQSLGFLAQQSHRVINLEACPILPAAVSACLPEIRALCCAVVGAKSADISVGAQVTVLRICCRSVPDTAPFQAFIARRYHETGQAWQIRLQTSGQCLNIPEDAPALTYSLPEFALNLAYAPDDFTQVNQALNRDMVALAVESMEITPGEPVLDLFCGLGNFALPLARRGAQVLGIEGVETMVAKASANAAQHGLAEQCRFQRADLFSVSTREMKRWGKREKWLLDPPRAGAQNLCTILKAPYLPKRIVYVSCNPGTLARDARLLADKGFHLYSGRVMNMFAQTAHIESMAVFIR